MNGLTKASPWIVGPACPGGFPAVRSHALRRRGLTLLSRQCCFEAASRVDPELAEDLVKVPFDRARTQEQLGADPRVGESVAGEPGDLLLLRRELLVLRESALAWLRAGGGKLVPSALGERLHPDLGEELLSRPQPIARLTHTALATQPLAEEQVRPGKLGTQSRQAQPIDRFAVEVLGRSAVAQQRP